MQHRFGVVYLSLRCHRNVFGPSGIKHKFQDPVADLSALARTLFSRATPEEAISETTSSLVKALAKLQEFMEGMEKLDDSMLRQEVLTVLEWN